MSNITIFTDGGARGNPGPAGIGVYVVDEDQSVVNEISLYINEATNNEAEYTAVIEALKWLATFSKDKSIEACQFCLDSMLVVEQVNGKWKVKEPRLQALHLNVQQLRKTLPFSTQFKYVPRAQNADADRLVNQAIDAASLQ